VTYRTEPNSKLRIWEPNPNRTQIFCTCEELEPNRTFTFVRTRTEPNPISEGSFPSLISSLWYKRQITRKQCKIGLQLQWCISSKSYVIYRSTPFWLTVNDPSDDFRVTPVFYVDIYILTVRKNKRPPYWNFSSRCDFDQIAVICALFCIKFQIAPKSGHPWRSYDVVCNFKMAAAVTPYYFRFRI